MINVSHKSEEKSIVENDTSHISLRTNRKYVKKGDIWKSNGHGPVKLEHVVLLFHELVYGYDAVGC